jgi:nucleotide-binding universal stress UspA family protein
MFENILVCLDGTRSGEAIIPVVAEIATRFRSKVILLNVIVVPSFLVRAGKAELEPIQSAEIAEGEGKIACNLDETARKLMEKGLEVERVIVEGTADESIIACAKRYDASLIALTSHNRCQFTKILTGSITDYVQRNAGIPVLTINPEAPGPQ